MSARKYTVSGIICTDLGQPVWHGEVVVEAENVSDATEAGRTEIRKTIAHDPAKDSIQVLRVQQHSETFHKGEVSELADFGADFSPDRIYRYGLYRIWEPAESMLMVIGLNPSTADECHDDATVRRCINFARGFGHGGLIMTNAFAFRATSPKALKTIADPVGPENDAFLQKLSQRAAMVLAAWGNHAALGCRGAHIRKLLPNLHCFGVTGQGEPRHPLYLKKTLQPELLPPS